MNELKQTFRRMAVYYLLLAINIIPCASIIPDVFPFRNLSAIYLIVLCVCLVLYYAHRVSSAGRLSLSVKLLSWFSLLLILLRAIKYSVFNEVGIIDRHIWYLYYVPMLMLPLLLFYTALFVAPKNGFKFKKWYWTAALTALLIILVLTNDLHQFVFKFNNNFENWDNDYSYGFLFYLITLWRYALYIASIVILTAKCSVSSAKRNSLIILIPFAIGLFLNTLLVTGKMPSINGSHIIEFPETMISTAAVVIECCMQLGLIPTNRDYGKLFQKFSISAQITDKKGRVVYSSNSAAALSEEQFSIEESARIGEHTVLHKMVIPGGYGFWQDDLTELDRLNEELAEAKEKLAEESELIRLKSELKNNQVKIEQRTFVYDNIAKQTHRQSQLISRLAKTARNTDDLSVKEECRGKITLLGAYIKRYANLMILSNESNAIETGELALSVSEVLRYLNYCKVPGEVFSNVEGYVSSGDALCAFEAFEYLIETNLSCLKGTFVNISVGEKVVFKMTMESLKTPLSEELIKKLGENGVLYEYSSEDDVAYICFTLPKGGETL
ncbi:MAG: hypothetical protein IKR97_04290 [Eubacterium sp.]|nr:hypothetical protein [Eubacterium sp.]